MEKLISIKELFVRSFAIYKQKFFVFIKLIAINAVIILFGLPLSILFFLPINKNFYISIILFTFLIAGVFAALVIAFLIKVSLMLVVKERSVTMSVKEYLSHGLVLAGSYAWVSFIVALTVLGGFILLIIPGIVFAVWFSFSTYVFIAEGKKGKSAMVRSKELVKGYWWVIFGRLLVIGILGAIVSQIPFLGYLINLLFMMPLTLIYMYLLYEDLKRIKT